MPEPSSSELIKKQNATVSQEVAVARRVTSPRPVTHDSSGPSVTRNDILFALFKHKKKIVLGTIAGLAAAAGVYFFVPPIFESDAKLLVRYLVERGTVDSMNNLKNPDGFAPTTDTVINAEVQILSSWDLAVQTAEAIGPKQLGAATKEDAAGAIASGLAFDTHKNSNIIGVSYQNPNPRLARLVLNELVNRYFVKHLEVHRSAGAFDFVTQQTDQVRARLNQTEDTLKDLKEKAGIVSLTDTTAALSSEAAKTEERLHEAEADLAEQQARVQQMNGSVATPSITGGQAKTASPAPGTTTEHDAMAESGKPETSESTVPSKQEAPPEVLQKYQVVVSGLQKLRQTQLELFAKYTPTSQMVKANQTQIDEVDKQRRDLEKKYPDLPSRIRPTGASRQLDPAAEMARVAGLQAKKDALAARLRDVQKRIKQLSQLDPQIGGLERQKQLLEDNYKYFEATLEKARIDEALDPSKIPNISAVQRPSPPARVTKTRNKIMAGAAVAGFALAVVYALLKELVLTVAVRRGVEIEKVVGISALMSIPYRSVRNGASVPKRNGKLAAVVPGFKSRNLAPWDSDHFIRPYSEAIRDRLGLYFELHNLTHKPKLVGVTGLSNAAGTSTLAAGLAAAVSATNDGKVLLVDVSLGPDHVHPFFKGKPAYPLKTALKFEGPIEAAADNLYLATVGSSNAGPAQLGLKKFFDLMPNLKASDFDYIIFDMPPLGQTSPTWGMAPFMDKVLLVVESEKNTREAMKRSYRRLVAERDNVAVVLNKVRSYAPKKLELEL